LTRTTQYIDSTRLVIYALAKIDTTRLPYRSSQLTIQSSKFKIFGIFMDLTGLNL